MREYVPTATPIDPLPTPLLGLERIANAADRAMWDVLRRDLWCDLTEQYDDIPEELA